MKTFLVVALKRWPGNGLIYRMKTLYFDTL